MADTITSCDTHISLKGKDPFVVYKVSPIYKSKLSTLNSLLNKSQFHLKNL